MDDQIRLSNSGIVQNIKDIGAELSEVAVDSLVLENGLLKDIPLIGTLVKIYNTLTGFRDYSFQRKIALFLQPLHDISAEELAKFQKRLDTNEQKKIGETLLLLLERFDDYDKPTIAAKLLKACIEGKIDHTIMLRLCTMVDRAISTDFKDLVISYHGGEITPTIAQSLANVGLMTPTSYDDGMRLGSAGGFSELSYSISEYGKLLVEIALL